MSRKGTPFTVIYRSRPAFQIVPVDDKGGASSSLADNTLYRAAAVGSSDDGRPSITTRSCIRDEARVRRYRRLDGVCGPWWQQIDGSTRRRWERVENDRFERARNLFFQYRDKDLSFTDYTSFAVMRELRLTTVISTDNHFRQVGFEVLPEARPRRRKPRRP